MKINSSRAAGSASALRLSSVSLAMACLLATIAAAKSPVAPPENLTSRSVSLSLFPPVKIDPGTAAPDAPTIAGCPVTGLPNDNSTSGNERAPNLRNRFGRTVYVILQTELAAGGIAPGTQLSGIGWTFSTSQGLSGSGPLIVYMQNTADTTNLKSTTWSTAITGMSIVRSATTTIPNVTGSWDVPFTSPPFVYSCAGLYVAFDAQFPV